MKKIRIKLVSLMLALLALLSCVSCAVKIKAEELSSGYRRTASESGEVDEKFISSMADFSFELFKGLNTKDSENDLMSPLSAVICLAMIANGAEGETKKQMEEAFGLDIETLNRCLYAYTEALYSSDKCKVSIADSIWFLDDGTLHIKENFLQTNADWYDAQIYGAPFDDGTVKDINHWCKKYTDGMIDNIIEEIPENVVMYLINALIFDAEWETKYEKRDIASAVFRNYGGTRSDVEMMYSAEDKRSFIAGEGVKGFVKSYSGGKYGFVGLLPDEGTDIYAFADSLNGEKWLSLWESRNASKGEISGVRVGIPEFSYGVKTKLNDTLKAMGMTDMFDEACADFSGMSETFLSCSAVEQKVFIDVSRTGTKAAAVTWGSINSESATILESVILDRPFVYMIVDCETGLPLFIGVVSELG